MQTGASKCPKWKLIFENFLGGGPQNPPSAAIQKCSRMHHLKIKFLCIWCLRGMKIPQMRTNLWKFSWRRPANTPRTRQKGVAPSGTYPLPAMWHRHWSATLLDWSATCSTFEAHWPSPVSMLPSSFWSFSLLPFYPFSCSLLICIEVVIWICTNEILVEVCAVEQDGILIGWGQS